MGGGGSGLQVPPRVIKPERSCRWYRRGSVKNPQKKVGLRVRPPLGNNFNTKPTRTIYILQSIRGNYGMR